MNNHKYSAIIALSVALLGLLLGCRRAPSTMPPVATTIKEIIALDWDKNLTEMPSLFHGGQMRHGDIKSKRHACYAVAAVFTNINAEGTLRFHQSAKDIYKGSLIPLSGIGIALNSASPEEQERMFNDACAQIKSIHKYVFTDSNPSNCDAAFTIDPLSRDEYPHIRITKNHPSPDMMYIEIHQTKLVQKGIVPDVR